MITGKFLMSHPEDLQEPTPVRDNPKLKRHNLFVSTDCDVDTTVFTTPKPISTSTTRKEQKLSFPDSDLDESLGILSIHSEDIDSIGMTHERERSRARSCLERASRVSNIPSRFLRPSEKTGDSSFGGLAESTISESDLLESSTPKDSLLDDDQLFKKPFPKESIAQTAARLSMNLRNTSMSMRDALEDCRLSSVGSEAFDSRVEEKLMADELSWKRKYGSIPVAAQEFSINSASKMSVGDFFHRRSDDLTQLLGRSPEKHNENPVPLVEVSFNSVAEEVPLEESFSISAIQKILSDTKKTPGRALDILTSQPGSSKQPHKASPLSVPEKENIEISHLSPENPESVADKSIGSCRSSSSLSNFPNGKLPIESTKTELVWGCVKIGRTVTQEFTLRNKSSHRLKLQCHVSQPSFKIFRADSDLVDQVRFVLRPYESRTITVSFSPMIMGAVRDELNFTPIEPHLKPAKRQYMMLMGYGGHGSVTIHNVAKDTSKKYWLSLGSLGDNLSQTFFLQNTGVLPSFAFIEFQSKEIYMFKNVSIRPNRVVLKPNERREVVISFVPKKEDLNYIKNCVSNTIFELGVLKVTSGTEVDRGRIRKLCWKVQKKGLEVEALEKKLKEKFPDESIPADVGVLNEPVEYMRDLVQMLNHQEIIVTAEQDPDRTVVNEMAEYSSMFHTLCQENTVVDIFLQERCKVEPTKIILTPPLKTEDVIFLTTECDKKFEVNCLPQGLEVTPRSGVVRKQAPTIIRVKYGNGMGGKKNFKVVINAETESLEVDVKVITI